jgi:hypothetical protein
MNTHDGTPTRPVVLTCPACGQSVVLQVPGAASCVQCARTMEPRVPATAREPVQA